MGTLDGARKAAVAIVQINIDLVRAASVGPNGDEHDVGPVVRGRSPTEIQRPPHGVVL
jgi:hypothetical protein